MMGTLAAVPAGKKIKTHEGLYSADVEGDIENVNNVLKITQIRVKYHLKVPKGRTADARDALSSYIALCPGAQSVIGCIRISDEAIIEELEAWNPQKRPADGRFRCPSSQATCT